MYYRGMRACLDNPDFNSTIPANDNGTRTASQVNAGQLDIQQKKGFGYLAPSMDDGDDGTVDCMDGSIFVRGATIFGFDNTVELICAMNRALGSSDNGRIEPSNGTDCEQSQEFKFDGGGGDVFQRALTKALESEGSKDRPAFNINDNSSAGNYTHQALLYLIGKNSLETFCGEGAPLSSATGGSIEGGDVVSVDVVTSDGVVKPSQAYAVANTDRDQDSKVDDIYYNQGGDVNNAQDLKCHEMAKMTRDNSAAYAAWARENKELAEQNDNTSRTSDTTGGGESATTCAIDGIGWIICPVMTFMAGLVDSAYNQIASWLLVTPLTTTTTGGGGEGTMYSAWSTMRNIANIAFVIAFMVIIYSQLTSVGLSNYGIKKMLPKIMVAAILVNVSYWICAVAVDVSNIAGQSLYSLFDTDVYTQGIKTDEFDGEISSSGNGWTGLVAAILASAGLYLALPALIVALPAALFAIVTVFLVLALRQVLIILLVVISPLAFVALLLPNTEDWFKKWKALLQTLLLLYPIIAVIFGASAMASTIVMNSAKDIEGDGKLPIQIMGALITILPLAITPIIMKFGGGVLNRFGGMINNPNKGPFDALRKRAEATAGRIRNNRDIRAVNGMRNGGRLVPQSMSMRRRGLDSASKRDQIQRQRDSAVKSLAYQGTTQNYTKRANDQDKITQRLENDFEVRDIQGQLDGAGLHADVRADLLNSQFSRKVAESTEKDRAEEAHIMNNRNGYQQMYAAGENLEAQKTESHNEFGRTEMGELTAQRVKSAGGEKKIIEGEHELAFQGSNVGMAQAGQMKAVDGQLDIVRGEQEIEFEGSGVGVAQAITKDNVAQRKSAVTARSETAAVQQNADVRIQAQAAKDTLDVAKADETAFIQELRTEKGAAEHLISQQSPEVQAVVQELQQADTQRRVETQRATNAQTVATYEYATAVGTDTANPSQLAVDAGGIAGRAGVSQAQAVARQTMLKAANEAISAEKSTMSTMKARSATPGEESHMSIVSDPNASPERRAAAAGMIMQNGSMEDIHELSDVVQRMGNTDEARDIRMQMVSDMNRTPFGWGAGDIAALKRGEAAINPDTGAPKDYNEMMDMRAKAKLSDSKWANLDPDDLRKYSDLATNGQLTGESLQNLVDATYDAETNDNISLTTEAKKHGEAIRAYAATIGINPTP